MHPNKNNSVSDEKYLIHSKNAFYMLAHAFVYLSETGQEEIYAPMLHLANGWSPYCK